MSEDGRLIKVEIVPPFKLTKWQQDAWDWAISGMQDLEDPELDPDSDWCQLEDDTLEGQREDLIYRIGSQLSGMHDDFWSPQRCGQETKRCEDFAEALTNAWRWDRSKPCTHEWVTLSHGGIICNFCGICKWQTKEEK
jgi:hypothetical protein